MRNRLSFVDTEPPNEPPQHTKAQGNSAEKSAFSRYYVAHKIHKGSLIVLLQELKSKKNRFSHAQLQITKDYMQETYQPLSKM